MLAAVSTNTMEAMLEGTGEVVPIIKLIDGKQGQRTPRNEVDNWDDATAFVIRHPNGETALIEIAAISFLNFSS